MRRFEPVHLPPDRALNHRVSQTLAAKFNACRRSAYLYQTLHGGAGSHQMLRGSGLHEVLARAINATIDAGELTIPPELVKAIVDEVLAEIDVPIEEHDYLRESAYRWASETAIDPAAVIAVETLFVLELGDWSIRGKIDFAEMLDGGARVRVKDWKSSRSLPSFEEISRKRPDGTQAAKGFQLVLYALMLAFGRPVRIEPCASCSGKGFTVEVGPAGMSARIPCSACGGFDPLLDVRPKDRTPDMKARMGHGYVEIVEPFPLADRAREFDLELVFPGIENREGKMATTPVTLRRSELEEYKASFAGLLRRLEQAERDGDWPAVPGSHCNECPAQQLCPIPSELRDFAGSINTIEQASQTAEKLDRTKARDAAIQKELKAFAKAHNAEIRYGTDKAWRFVFQESEEIKDKDALWAAVERTVSYGDPFDRSLHVRKKKSTNFKVVTLTAEELDEISASQEGSNGSTDDHAGDGTGQREEHDASH